MIGYVLVLTAVALWSLNGVLAKVVVTGDGLSAMRLAEVRATGAALLLFAAVALIRPKSLRVTPRETVYLVLFGIFGLAFVHFFYFLAISRMDIGIALVIQYIAPVLIALWARFFVHEPVRRRLWIALALSLTGLTLVVELWGGGGALNATGVGACLAAAVAYAVYILMADHSLQRGRDAFSLLAWGFVFAALFWALAQPWWTFPVDSLTGETSLMGRLEEFDAPAWLGEELSPGQIVGGILVLGGIVLAQTARTGERTGERT